MKINEEFCKEVRAHNNWPKTRKRNGLLEYISWITRDSTHSQPRLTKFYRINSAKQPQGTTVWPWWGSRFMVAPMG